MRKNPTAEQKQAAQERREKFRALVKKVAAMTDEERSRILDRIGAIPTVEGRALSLHNTILLVHQLPNVSMVGGFRQWIAAGRAVRKGEHGLAIWLPCAPGKDEDEDQEVRFLMGTVFDISQTDELPIDSRLGTVINAVTDRLDQIHQERSVPCTTL